MTRRVPCPLLTHSLRVNVDVALAEAPRVDPLPPHSDGIHTPGPTTKTNRVALVSPRSSSASWLMVASLVIIVRSRIQIVA